MTTNSMTAQPSKAGRREWIGLAVLALPTLLLSLDMSVLYLALPHLSADLRPTSSELLWMMDIYGFMVAGFLVTMGTLGDRIGRRKLLMIGGSAFALASIAAAYSTSAEMLIVTRALLGIAGATLMPSTLALISNMFQDTKERGIAIATWMTCFMGGMSIGPIIGGAMLEVFWWGACFLLGVPVMVLLLLAAPRLLPEYRDDNAGRLDLVSVGLSLASILPLIYGLKEIARDGVQAVPVLSIAVGLGVGWAFVRRQRRLADPLLDLRLFGNRKFSAALSIMLLGGVAMAGSFFFVSQYLQMVAGLSPIMAGLWMVPPMVAMIAATQATPHIAQRIRPAYVMSAGLVIAAIGLLLLTQVDAQGGLITVVVGMAVASAGIAPPSSMATELVVSSAPPEKAGSASSMSETSGEFGIAMGVAMIGSIGTAIYRDGMATAVPEQVPSAAADLARENIAGASAVADRLGGDLGAAVLEPAREAFTAGLNTAAGVSAVAMIVLAVVATVLLRQVRPTRETAESEENKDQVLEPTPC